MTDKYNLTAFKGTIKGAGRDFPEEAPFTQQRDCLKDIELFAYNAVIADIRTYGHKTTGILTEAESKILFRSGEYFQVDKSNPSRTVLGRYAVFNISEELRGIAILFIASNLIGPNTIELIGLRRFKSFRNGFPNPATIEHIILPEPKKHDHGF
jgi:hypothetical protein